MSKHPKILYDPQIFDIQNYGGISRYFTNLIMGIDARPDFEASLPLVYSQNYYIRRFSQLMNNKIGRKWLKSVKTRSSINKYYTKLQIRKSNFDIFHASYFEPYFLEDLTKPLVITIHDMIYENYPYLFSDSEEIIQQKRSVIENADLIIAISEYTKQQLLIHYPYVENKISVIYHGLPPKKFKPSNEVLPKQFLLYVGDRTAGYKNFIFMIKACAPILSQNPALQFICSGGGDFNAEELACFDELGISNRITQISATDALIDQLYKEALLFIYPSLEEGFGLPMLEAFKNGCAVACSNTSCLPEVGGEAAAYFAPDDPDSIQTTIAGLIENPIAKNHHIKLGYEQLKKFTFENCLNQTLACYQSLIHCRYE